MMSAPATRRESSEDGGGRKTASSGRQGGEKCPRCDSANTKFCYYNNYSLTQPRHFCKSCRRYWTKGGALRSVPIGGGCRKNKKVKPSSRFSSSMDCKESGGGSFFHHQYSPSSSSCMAMALPLPLPLPPHHSQYLSSSGIQGMSSNFNSMNLASSIESLSCINQDLHWKLQHQRLSMLFGGDSSRHNDAVSGVDLQRQPLFFQNLDISNSNSKVESTECEPPEMCGVNVGGNSRAALLPTEWFFGASSSNYASTSSLTPTPPTPAAPANGNHNESITNNWTTSLHAWDDVHHQYTAFP